MDSKLVGITSFAVLVEGCITYMNQFFVEGHFYWQMLMSIIFGILTSIAYNLDIPSFFNFKSKIPFVGNLITGILISRGSNYIYDLFSVTLSK